eukprot:scaffold29622_cov67-Phaeocystis_antarctica.AAC.3
MTPNLGRSRLLWLVVRRNRAMQTSDADLLWTCAACAVVPKNIKVSLPKSRTSWPRACRGR